MKELGRAVIIIIFTMAVNIILPLANGNRSTKQTMHALEGNCSYSIEIETKCAPFAGTGDAVGIRFGDSAGNHVLVKHLTDPKSIYDLKEGGRKDGSLYSGLKRCAIDMFIVNGTCMSRRSIICYLYVKQYGSDGWRPGWVKVLHRRNNGLMSPASYTFYFRTFVPENVWFGFDYCGPNRSLQPQIATHRAGME